METDLAEITLLQGVCYVVLFFVCVVLFATVRARSVRQIVLFSVSIVLYLTWVPWFAAVLFTSIVINFLLGKWLRRNPHWMPLLLGVLFNLGLLGVFKYIPELAGHARFNSLQAFAGLALPLGISFWTFQALSYLFDLYRREELDPSFLEFALYMAFFPVTIAGPVCRLPEMLPQFRSANRTASSDLAQGFRRIALGIFMMQLAKLLGQGILAGDGISGGFDRLTQWSAPDVWCLAFGYGLQLFFDFAGYSHIAIGAARMLGVTVPENFARPFASTSPSIFWTRWHMSLSFWIRDYVFLFLIVLRRDAWWRNTVLIVAMVLFGVWHKASLLFLLWGLYHGVLLVLHRQIEGLRRRFDRSPSPLFWTPLSWLATISTVSLGWILFRANSLSQARTMLSSIFSPASYGSHVLSTSFYGLVFALALGYAAASWLTEILHRYEEQSPAADAQPVVAWLARSRWYWIPPLYVLGMLLVFTVTVTQSGNAAQLMYRGF